MHDPAGDAPAPAFWIAPDRYSAPEVRRGRRWVWCALAVFAIAMWFVIPHGIGFSWRECDTQAIARNFLSDGFDPLRPRVDWRGDTDGAVECEFPLYQLMIASVLAFVGDCEWPGRLLALLATIWAAFSLHRLLELRAGPGGALAGLLVFLTCGSTIMIGSRVMPDAFSLALGVASVTAFVRYLAIGSRWSLWLSMTALALAGAQKPLALQLGLLMFGWTLVLAPRRLREPRLWCGFAIVLVLVSAWLVHGVALQEETGLSFGVISGDTKFPSLDHMLTPKIHAQLAWTTLQYGLSGVGVVALLALLLGRRLDKADLVLLGTVAIGLYVSLRYSYHQQMGPHYHMFAALAGAWCVARIWPADGRRIWWGLLFGVVTLQATWRFDVERQQRFHAIETPLMEVAASIRRLSKPDDLVVVRGSKPRVDATWNRRNNFENPSVFYQTGLRGWVLPVDGFDVKELDRLHRRGARLVYDSEPGATSPEVERWLGLHGESVIESANVHVHRLRSMP